MGLLLLGIRLTWFSSAMQVAVVTAHPLGLAEDAPLRGRAAPRTRRSEGLQSQAAVHRC